MSRAASYIDLDLDRAPTAPADGWENHAIDVLLEITDSMTSVDRVDVALNRLASLALRATGADRSAILLRDPRARTRMLPASGASRLGNIEELHERFRGMDPVEFPDDLELFTPGAWSAVTLPDAAASPLIPESWKRAWGSKSLAFAPLRAGDDLFGVLLVDYAEGRHTFTRQEVNLFEAIAKAAGMALRNAHLVERVQRAATIERRLGECAAALLSKHSLAEILDLIADRFTSLLPETSCAIYLLSQDLMTIQPAAFRGPTPPGALRLDELPFGGVERIQAAWATDPRRPVLIPDTRAHQEWKPFIPAEIGTGMLVPLPIGDEILGFVAVGRPSDPFTTDEIGVATAFADQAALALGQARLTGSLETRLKLIEGFSRLSDAVGRTSAIKAALSTLNRGVCADVGVRCTRLSFADPALANLLDAPTATEEEITAIRTWRRQQMPELFPRGDAIMVPVSLGNRPAGVLWVRSSTPLDRSTLDLVRAIAAGLGQVAYKAKLRRTGERRSQELAVTAERERIARDLHDTVGQTFYGIGLKLQDVLLSMDDQEAVAESLRGLRSLAAQGVADVRSVVYSLSLLNVRECGFLPSLRSLTLDFARTTGVACDLRINGRLPALPAEAQSTLYRVAHEALVNVERHARATGVMLTLSITDAKLELAIRDDGVGLGQRDVRDWRSAAHFGVRTMAKTVEEIGGRFQMSEAHPRGLLITATLPLAAERRRRR